MDGKIHGTQIWFEEDGAKLREVVFENGKQISEKKLKEVADEKPAEEQKPVKALFEK